MLLQGGLCPPTFTRTHPEGFGGHSPPYALFYFTPGSA
jgi:hypothetical protein